MNLEKSDKEIFEYVQREIAAWRNMEWAVREYAQLYQPGDARNSIANALAQGIQVLNRVRAGDEIEEE